MKRWSFDVRSWEPNQAAPVEGDEQAWKEHLEWCSFDVRSDGQSGWSK